MCSPKLLPRKLYLSKVRSLGRQEGREKAVESLVSSRPRQSSLNSVLCLLLIKN